MADIPIEKTLEAEIGPAEKSGPTTIQVNPGNVPIVTVQLLNDISIKLGKIIDILEKNSG